MEEMLREGLPPWLEEDLRLALIGPASDPIGASIAAGRILRVGGVGRELRTLVEAWSGDWAVGANAAILGLAVESDLSIVSSLLHALVLGSESAQAALEVDFPLDEPQAATDDEAPAVALPASWAWDLLSARDDVESHLVTLGRAAIAHPADDVATWERRLVDAAARIDRVGRSLEGELGAALRRAPASPRSTWLEEIASVEWDGWWTAPLRAPAARAALAGWRSPEPLAGWRSPEPVEPRPRKRIGLRTGTAAPVHRWSTTEASESALSQPRTHPVAVLFEGKVEVFAVGTSDAAGPDEPVGLIVAETGDQLDRIKSVDLRPPLASSPLRDPVAGAWWVSLAGSGRVRRELVVGYRSDSGSELELEVIELESADP